MNIGHIIEGWRNHLIPPKELKKTIQEVSEFRMDICKGCPKFSENAKKEGYETVRVDAHCTSCGCPLISKTKSLSSDCPLGKWGAYVTTEERNKIEQEIKEDEKGPEEGA